MGRQTSRIIWGKTKRKTNDGDTNMYPVTDYEDNVIYTSGNFMIFFDQMKGEFQEYKCVAAELCGQTPLYHEDKWECLGGTKLIEKYHVPGAPSYVDKIINSKRQTYNPGARVIVEEDGKHYVYMCIKKTNVYLDGFNKNYWSKVYQSIGILYKPLDHKEVYYDDGKNTTKWHRAMYYLPDEPFESEEEISEFDEFTRYYKGEKVIFSLLMKSHYNPYADLGYYLYEYLLDRPSEVTRTNDGYDDSVPEYRQPDPTYEDRWKKLGTAKEFSKDRSYNKGDMAIVDQYEFASDGVGWWREPIGIFDGNKRLMYGNKCLYRLKPNYGRPDILDLKAMANSEYKDYYIITDETGYADLDDPETYKPRTQYAVDIESGEEIYGLYSYIKTEYSDEKVTTFERKDWKLIVEARQRDRLIQYVHDEFKAGETLLIDYCGGTWGVYKCTKDNTYGNYTIYSDGDPNGARTGCFYKIEDIPGKPYPYGINTNPYGGADGYWELVNQNIKDATLSRKVYQAIEDIKPGQFDKNKWTIVTQKKFDSDELYGLIWQKLAYVSGGGVPFGCELVMQNELGTGSVNALRFNRLQIFRGNNILELGNVVYPNHSEGGRYMMQAIGTTAVVYQMSSYKTFFLRKPFASEWCKFELPFFNNGELQLFGNSRFFWDNNVITITGFNEDDYHCKFYKMIILDVESRSYYLSQKDYPVYDPDVPLPHFYNDPFCDGYSIKSGLMWDERYLKTAFTVLMPSSDGGWEDMDGTVDWANMNPVFNKDGEIIDSLLISYNGNNTHLENFFLASRSEFYILKNIYSVMNGPISHLISFIETDLTYVNWESSERVRFYSYYLFDDGWDSPTSPWTKAFSDKVMHADLIYMQDTGIVLSYFVDVEEKPEDFDIDGHHAYKLVQRKMTYQGKRAYYVLMIGSITEYVNHYGFPAQYLESGELWDYIGCNLVYDQHSFWSRDRRMFYNLEVMYGYVADKMIYDDEYGPNNVGLYHLIILTSTDENGVQTSRPVVDYIDQGYYTDDQQLGLVSKVDASREWVLGAGNVLHFLYRDYRYAYYVNEKRGAGYLYNSSGIWQLDLHDAKFNLLGFYGFASTKLSYMAIFYLCWLEKIPYYGNNTCHISGRVNMDIKYLNLQIIDWFPTQRDKDEFYDEKLEEWKKDKCLTLNGIGWISRNQDIPFVSTSSNGVVSASSSLVGAGDVVLTNSCVIYSEDNMHSCNCEIVVVLPNFRNEYPKIPERCGYGTVAKYDPIINGAYFWLTSNENLTYITPKYGGPEPDAQGFSGW